MVYFQHFLTVALNDCVNVAVNVHPDVAVNQLNQGGLNVMVMDAIITDADFRVKVDQVVKSYVEHEVHLDYFQTFLMPNIMNFLGQMHYLPMIMYLMMMLLLLSMMKMILIPTMGLDLAYVNSLEWVRKAMNLM